MIIILLRAGLSLNLEDLKKAGRPAILMCFVPACFEVTGMIILAPILLGVSRLDAAIMGAVVGAVSPALIVPRMIKLTEEGWGTKMCIRDRYTQDMVEYIKAVSNEWTEHFETYSQTEYIDDAEFFIMEPFQTWNKTPSGETCSEGYVLPVVYENQVICTVMLYQVDHSWHYSLSNDLCKELNKLINYSRQDVYKRQAPGGQGEVRAVISLDKFVLSEHEISVLDQVSFTGEQIDPNDFPGMIGYIVQPLSLIHI